MRDIFTATAAAYEVSVNLCDAASVSLDNELELEVALLKPLLSGKHIQRYATPDGELLLFPYHVVIAKQL